MHATVYTEVRGNFWELALSYHVGLEDRTQVGRLSSNLHLISLLSGPEIRLEN